MSGLVRDGFQLFFPSLPYRRMFDNYESILDACAGTATAPMRLIRAEACTVKPGDYDHNAIYSTMAAVDPTGASQMVLHQLAI